MRQVFDHRQQRRLMTGYYSAMAGLQSAVASLCEQVNGNGRAESERYRAQLTGILDFYRAHVPVLPLSRCPFTGRVVSHSIDPWTLNGLWWNHEAPVRPAEDLPPTFFALAGALKFAGEIESTPFICRTGPEVPFVVPGLLAHRQIRAVVSEIGIGRHRGYPIFYFADPVPHKIERFNAWGANEYIAFDRSGVAWLGSTELAQEHADFDLEPWIRAGKLLWIAPQDASLRLHGHARRCPYTNIDGRREFLSVREGKISPTSD